MLRKAYRLLFFTLSMSWWHEKQRWVQLALGIVIMAAVSNLQYGWTLFVGPLDATHHWGRVAIQVAFSIFVWVQTLSTPAEGHLIDRFGPRPIMFLSALLVALSWVVDAHANTLGMLYAGAVFGGLGVGIATTVAYGNVMKWFSARRGLAVGLTAAGFGMGGILTIGYLADTIQTSGYQHAFLLFGVLQGLVLLLVAPFLKAPAVIAPAEPIRSARDYHPFETVRTPVFWVMYFMFVMVGAGGLMATAQLAPIANDYHVAGIGVTLFGLTYPALVFALKLNQIMNGFSRLVFGRLSDWLGREWTMSIAFMAEGTGVFALAFFAHDPLLFVLLSGLTFFAWGEIYSLFPALSADLFGRRFASSNYGWLYTAKGVAAAGVPLGSLLMAYTGSWTPVLIVAGTLDVFAAGMAVLILLPLRRLHLAAEKNS